MPPHTTSSQRERGEGRGHWGLSAFRADHDTFGLKNRTNISKAMMSLMSSYIARRIRQQASYMAKRNVAVGKEMEDQNEKRWGHEPPA